MLSTSSCTEAAYFSSDFSVTAGRSYENMSPLRNKKMRIKIKQISTILRENGRHSSDSNTEEPYFKWGSLNRMSYRFQAKRNCQLHVLVGRWTPFQGESEATAVCTHYFMWPSQDCHPNTQTGGTCTHRAFSWGVEGCWHSDISLKTCMALDVETNRPESSVLREVEHAYLVHLFKVL